MTPPWRLPEARTAYRIGDPAGQYPVYSAEGARRVDGRWHRRGDAVIYASAVYSTAMLERLVHWNGLVPPNQHYVEIALPAGLSYEVVTPDSLPDWHQRDGDAARAFGHAWYAEGRSGLLIVPSVVARLDRNIVINARHPDAARISVGLETPIWWDDRLFR